MERPDVQLHLVFVFGLGNQHARNEGPQRQAQARQLGDPGQPQSDQQQVEHKQFLALSTRHQGQPPTHHTLTACHQQGDQDGGFERGHHQSGEHLVSGGAEGRDHHNQGHHRQILKQQHTHHPLAVLRFQLQPVGHQFDHNRCAAHGHGARQRERGLPLHLPQRGRQGGHKQGEHRHDHQREQHLQQAQAKHMLAHGAQLGQVEFEPDHKHQKHHAELGQVFHAFGVLCQRQGVGANHHTHRQIAQHGRQLEHAAAHHAQHGGQQIQQGQLQSAHAPMVTSACDPCGLAADVFSTGRVLEHAHGGACHAAR